MDANPTLSTVIDAGSGTKKVTAKAGYDTIDSNKTEYVRRMDFSSSWVSES